MPGPTVVGRPADVAPWTTVYYVPPPQQGPNLFAAYWAGFNATRSKDADKLMWERINAAGPDPIDKAKAKAALLAVDADLARQANDSTRYAQQQVDDWNKWQVTMRGQDTELQGRVVSGQAQDAAAAMGLDQANLNAQVLNGADSAALAKLQTGVETALSAARLSGTPENIESARALAASAAREYEKAYSTLVADRKPGEAQALAVRYNEMVKNLQTTAGDQLYKSVIAPSLPTFPEAPPATSTYRGVSATPPPRVELRDGSGSTSVTTSRSGGSGGSAAGPAAGGSGSASASGGAPGTVTLASPRGDATTLAAIQNARDEVARALRELEVPWKSPLGEVGDPLITRAPRFRAAPPEPAPKAEPPPSKVTGLPSHDGASEKDVQKALDEADKALDGSHYLPSARPSVSTGQAEGEGISDGPPNVEDFLGSDLRPNPGTDRSRTTSSSPGIPEDYRQMSGGSATDDFVKLQEEIRRKNAMFNSGG